MVFCFLLEEGREGGEGRFLTMDLMAATAFKKFSLFFAHFNYK